MNMLVAEDEALTLRLIMEVLFAFDIEPHATYDSRIASDWMDRTRFDAILVDAGFPVLDDIHLVRKVKSSALNSKTPIIFLAGGPDQHHVDKAQSEGNELIVVRKPVEKSLLVAAIRATPGLLVDERRRFRRVPVSVEVFCREGPRKFVGRTVDLSEYGVQVESDKALEERHSVNLMFTLPGQIKPIEAMGVVVRQVDEQRAGILFTQLDNDASLSIRQFLASQFAAV